MTRCRSGGPARGGRTAGQLARRSRGRRIAGGAVGIRTGPRRSPTDRIEVDPTAPRRRRRRGLRGILPAPLWQVGRLLILALLVEYLVVPQLAGPRKLVHLLIEVNPLLLLAGVALEVAALVSYAQLTRTMLTDGRSISLWTVERIQLATLSVSHCTPGGAAAGTALGFRLFTHNGVAGSDVGFALASQAIGSAVVLNVILWLALVISIPVWGFSAVYLLAGAVGVVLLALAAFLLLLFSRGEDRVGAWLERVAARIPFIDGQVLRKTFAQFAARLAHLQGDRRRLIRALIWATANWLFDAGSLAVFVGAFGHWANPDGLLVAYGLAYVLAVIPITPGGLGVVEATLTSILVGFGTPRGVATLGVIGYRLINFWLPIPVGGLAYLSLQVDGAARNRRLARAGGRMRRRLPFAQPSSASPPTPNPATPSPPAPDPATPSPATPDPATPSPATPNPATPNPPSPPAAAASADPPAPPGPLTPPAGETGPAGDI